MGIPCRAALPAEVNGLSGRRHGETRLWWLGIDALPIQGRTLEKRGEKYIGYRIQDWLGGRVLGRESGPGG